MAIDYNSHSLINLVQRTIVALENINLPLEMPGSLELEETRARLFTQLKTRILPHMQSSDLPTVVVLGGSSGAGKSALFNALTGDEYSPSSVIRPTTREPYIAIHPDDMPNMENHSLLEMGNVISSPQMIKGIVLVDAPDLDSVEEKNRELSRRLLDAADMWLFVTTSSRYGDALAWQVLNDAHKRGLTIAVVINRITEKALKVVREDIVKRLQKDGMDKVPVLTVMDAGPHEGLLESYTVEPVKKWLDSISSTSMNSVLVDRATQAMLPEIGNQLYMLADAVEMQSDAVQDLSDKVSIAISNALEEVQGNATKGRYGKGAPTTSWLTLASTGGALHELAIGVKPSILRRRYKGERDAAITTVFDGVLTAIKVGLTQSILGVIQEIDQLWGGDIIETSKYLAQAKESVDIQTIIRNAEKNWKADLLLLAQTIPENLWLSKSGIASMIGSAAGGISGVVTALRYVEASEDVIIARNKLADTFAKAFEEVRNSYTKVLDAIPVGSGRTLRLRAAEYSGKF